MSGPDVDIQSKDAGPGAVLAAAREEIGVSQREVAEALNLPITVVDAIEAGDNSRLPSHVFTRGYVRAYAKLLELDPDPLVAALMLDHDEQEITFSVPRKRLNLSVLQAMNPQIAIGAGIGLIILIILIGVFTGSDEDPAPVAEPTSTQPQALQDEPVQPTATPPDAPVEKPVTQARSVPVDEAETPQFDAPADQVLVSQAEQAPAATGPAVRRLTPEGDERLSLLFAEDCWVSIKGSQGTVLYGDLGKAGQTLEFVGAPPFTVLLGYAQGVVLKYNSEPIALAPHTRNNVATLVLGQ